MNFFVRFLEEFRIPTSPFGIYWPLLNYFQKTISNLGISFGNSTTDIKKIWSQRWHCKQYHLKLFTFCQWDVFGDRTTNDNFHWPPKSTFHAIWELKYSPPAEFGKTSFTFLRFLKINQLVGWYYRQIWKSVNCKIQAVKIIYTAL